VFEIRLEGELTGPAPLRYFNGVAFFEIVDGECRIEKLNGDENVQDKGDK